MQRILLTFLFLLSSSPQYPTTPIYIYKIHTLNTGSQFQFILQGIVAIITIGIPIGIGRFRIDGRRGKICIDLLWQRLATVIMDGIG